MLDQAPCKNKHTNRQMATALDTAAYTCEENPPYHQSSEGPCWQGQDENVDCPRDV